MAFSICIESTAMRLPEIFGVSTFTVNFPEIIPKFETVTGTHGPS